MLQIPMPPEQTVQLPVILLEDGENDFVYADFLPGTTAFGGFKTWPRSKSDFILIAECSEISGPNPIFTIPTKQHLVKNLNSFCIRLLSTDYQEFGSNKDMPIIDAQVLLPDIMTDVHAAVNHFTLYDAEARGFVRPFCIAYVTADKHKLLQLSETIFKSLGEAAAIIQQSNRNFCVDGLEKLKLDLELTKSTLSMHSNLQNNCNNPEERLKVYNRLIESCMKDIQQILTSVENTKGIEKADQLIEDLVLRLNHKLSPMSISVQKPCPTSEGYKPKQLKIPLQQNFDKQLKNLYHISPGGIILSLYHLTLIHKHFKRKYANIVSCSNYNDGSRNSRGCYLYFGACLKINPCGKCHDEEQPECHIKLPQSSKLYKFSDPSYFNDLNHQSFKTISDFLESQNALCNTCPPEESLESEGMSNRKNVNSPNGGGGGGTQGLNGIFKRSVETEDSEDPHCSSSCSNHVVTLNEMWDIIEYIHYDVPDFESIVLEIFRLITQSESLLYSLLTRNLIVILFTVGEEMLAKILLRVLAILTPRKSTEYIFVEHNRNKPILLQELKNMAAVSYCLPCQISDVLPASVKSSTAVINLSEVEYYGPRYSGCLLQDLNAKIRRLSFNDPVLPFLMNILMEVELQLSLWQEIVGPSPTSSMSALYSLQRDFTRCDIKIIEDLSKLCE